MKILLFGAAGQVGWELRRSLALLGDIVALDRSTPSPFAADFREPEKLAATLRAVQPNVVVNAAAFTDVDRCELEPGLAHTINAAAPAVLAREAAALGAWLVHFSSDYVFDGSGRSAWTENSPTAPLNAYGRSKLEGERAIECSGCNFLILRSSWVHAARGGNFLRSVLTLAAERDQLHVVDDQVGAPTGADTLADVAAYALRAALGAPRFAGTYHVAAAGETSWHGCARHIVEFAHAAGRPLMLQPQHIVAGSRESISRVAPRPRNSRLNTHKVQHSFGLLMPDWQSGVERTLTEIFSRDSAAHCARIG